MWGADVTGPVIYTYRAAEAGLFVNSYLVEGESGVVVADTSLLVSDIEALRARLAALNKPLLGVLVTHAHPDHLNGVPGLVRDTEVPVYAAASVGRVIGEIAQAKREQWSPAYGAEWPAETYYPNSLLADHAQVRLGELTFTVRELGPAESHADSFFLMSAGGSRPVAFTGDLAFHGTHPCTADGHLPQWLAALDDVGTLYPGHGDPATPGVLAAQRRYLLYYREMVRRLSGGEPRLSPAAAAELDTAMRAFLPGAPLTWMIGLGADAVAGQLAGAAAISPG